MNTRVHVRPLDVSEVGEARGESAGERAVEEAESEEACDPEVAEPVEIACEESAVRAAPDPGEPTIEERARHALTHLPFRPWCADCVRGKAPDDPHRRIARQPEAGPPKVSVDYGFVTADDGGDDQQRVILVVKVSGSKVIMARCVRGKGRADPHAVSWLVEQLRRLGIGRCVLQADGEPAQRTLVREVIEEACRTSDIGVAAQHSPAYDHQCNGAVEKVVRGVKDQVRVMMSALRRCVG